MGNMLQPELLIREPMVEGIWYPEDKEELLETIHDFLPASSNDAPASGLMVPFGPLESLGQAAASAYSSLRGGTWDRVVLVGPCVGRRRSSVYLPESTHFRSTLGMSPVDQEACAAMLDSSMLVERNDVPHLNENSLEMGLTLLHYFYPGIPVVPVLAGETNEALFRAMAAAFLLLESELPGRTLYLLNTAPPRLRHAVHIGNGAWWEALLAGNHEAMFRSARETGTCPESLIIMALGAIFVQKRGIMASWIDPDQETGTLAFR